MNLDDLLSKTRSKNYTCFEYASDVWQAITGSKLEQGDRESIDTPITPCLVYLSNSERTASHIGVFYKGRVYHLGFRGAQYVTLESLQTAFKKVSFYK